LAGETDKMPQTCASASVTSAQVKMHSVCTKIDVSWKSLWKCSWLFKLKVQSLILNSYFLF